MEARRWIVDLEGFQEAPTGTLVAECNVPNPVETEESRAESVWRMKDDEAGGWSEEPEVGCYAGEMPPKQVYFTGGPRGLAGVYTFRFRRPRGGRCSYRKEGKAWHAWWSSEQERWIVAELPAQDLETVFTEQPSLESVGDASSAEDVPHPAACSLWCLKALAHGRLSREESVRCEPVGKPPPAIVVQQRGTDGVKGINGIYFLGSDWYKHRGFFEKQCRLSKHDRWTVFFSSSNTKWYIHQHGLESTRGASACTACDVPDPTYAAAGHWCTRAEGGGWQNDHIEVHTTPEVPPKIFLFGAHRPGEAGPELLPLNGVYVVQEPHCRRAFYRKEVASKWALRFHPGQARWIVDGRGGEPQDDGTGECSVACDCWHPVAADCFWALHEKTMAGNEEPTRDKKANAKAGASPGGGRGGTFGSPSSASAQDQGLTIGTLNRRSLNLLAKSSTKQSAPSRAAPSVRLGKAKASEAGSSPAASSASGDRMSMASSAAGRSVTNSLASRSMRPRGNSRGPGSVSGMSVGSYASVRTAKQKVSSGDSVVSGLGPRSVAASSRQGSVRGSVTGSSCGSLASGIFGSEKSGASGRKRHNKSTGPWQKMQSIGVVVVRSPPELLHLTVPAPCELNGLFKLDGNFCGRPVYRLVDKEGKVRLELPTPPGPQPEAKLRRPSAFGYALHWSPAGSCWLLGEHSRTVRVVYRHLRPKLDIRLERDAQGLVRLADATEGGPTILSYVPLGSVLHSIDGDSESWLQAPDPCSCIESLDIPCELEFLCEGLDAESTHGIAALRYDAPDPSAASVRWEVSEEKDVWAFPDRPVQCRAALRPPVRIRVSGYNKKPRELNGLYDLLPLLHEGKPAYQNGRGRMVICWVALKGLWVIANIPGPTFEPGCTMDVRRAFAACPCWAPNPTATTEHGGLWQTRAVLKRRTLRVEADGQPLSEEQHQELVLASLRRALDEAGDPAKMQRPGRPGGRSVRFNPDKIRATCEGLDLLLTEAEASAAVDEEVLAEAVAAKRCLAGWMLLELVASQGEKGEKASVASWFETLTQLRALLRQDRADPTVAFAADGWTPLHFVAKHGYAESWTLEAATVLCSYRADPEATDKKGVTPVLLAVLDRNFKNVRALLRVASEHAQHLPLEDEQNRAAQEEIFNEAREGTTEAFWAVLARNESKVDLNKKTEDGYGAIHLAALRNQASMIDLLANRKADLNLKDNDGNTALHLAARAAGHVSVLILLRNGASTVIRNSDGSSAFMVVLENGAVDVLQEFKRQMVSWQEVEAVLGKERDDQNSKGWQALIKKKARRILELAFGDSSTDPMNPGKIDCLQLSNQLIIQDPDSSTPRCYFLELRAQLACKELFIPLLRLTGECQLEAANDSTPYKSLIRYLLAGGLGACAAAEVGTVTQLGLKNLEVSFETAFDVTEREMGLLTERQEQALCGRASSEAWPMRHQLFAHGELPWLSRDGGRKRMMAALGALVDAAAFQSVEELCSAIAAEQNGLMLVSASGTEVLLQPFWDSAYARWLVARSGRADAKLQARIKERLGGQHCAAVPKALSAVLERKGMHRRACDLFFSRERVGSGAHPMEAGGHVDIVRLSLTAESMANLADILRDFQALSMEKDGLELVFVLNDFANRLRSREYKDLQLGVLARMPDGGTPLLVEVKLILRRYLEMKRHKALLLSIHYSSDYNSADKGVHRLRTSLTAMSPGQFLAAAFPRQRWVTNEDPYSKHQVTVWCWARAEQLYEAGLEAPSSAEEPRDFFGRWSEILGDGSEQVLTQEAGLDKIARERDWLLSDQDLSKKLSLESGLAPVEGPSLQRLGMELASREARLFRDAEGKLLKVKDIVLLQLHPPNSESSLVRDTRPNGPPSGPRRACDTLQAVANRIVQRELPSFLSSWVRVVGHEWRRGCWLVRDARPQEGHIPAAKRFFIVKATFDAKADPFVLLRAGLGI